MIAVLTVFRIRYCGLDLGVIAMQGTGYQASGLGDGQGGRFF